MDTGGRIVSSIPVEPGLVSSVLRILGHLDSLPPRATGALSFGDHGVVLVDSKRICWAATTSTRRRLTDILRHQRTPPVPREAIEEVFRSCKETGKPLGEALVASGLVSETGLRSALLLHNSHAISALARSRAVPTGFVSHPRTGYDPKFAVAAAEVLAFVGALDDPARATAAQIELVGKLVPESSGVAFVRGGTLSGAQVIAVDASCEFPANEIVTLCTWAAGLFDVACTFDPTTSVARAVWCARTAIVTWRVKEVGYVGLCSSRAAAARLVSQLGADAVAASSTRTPRLEGVGT